MKDAFDTTDFQTRCVQECTRLLHKVGVTRPTFLHVRGRHTGYLQGEFAVAGHKVAVFVYPDEAEFSIDGKWSRYETPDFCNGDRLASSFLRDFAEGLRRIPTTS